MLDKRQEARVDVHVNALLQGEGVALKGVVKDLSLHGVYLETDQTLPVGTNVEVTMYPSPVPEPVVVNASGAVVRSSREGIGCTLDKMDPRSFAHLRTMIAPECGEKEEFRADEPKGGSR